MPSPRTQPQIPQWNDPFQMMTRLLEESGELAQLVNHFEGTGIKNEKYGTLDKTKRAKEVMDLLRCTLQISVYYNIEKELEENINETYERMKTEGLIEGWERED